MPTTRSTKARKSKPVLVSDTEDEFGNDSEFEKMMSKITDADYEHLSTPHKDRTAPGRERSESPSPAQGSKGKRSTVPSSVTARSKHGARRPSDKPIKAPAFVPQPAAPAPLVPSLSWTARTEISSAFQSTAAQSASSSHKATSSRPKPIVEYTIPDSDESDHEVPTDVETDVQTTSSSRSTSYSSAASTPFTSPDASASAKNPFTFTPKGKGVDRGARDGTTPKQARFAAAESISSAPRAAHVGFQTPKPNQTSKPSGTGVSYPATAATLSSRKAAASDQAPASSASTAGALPAITGQTPARPKLNVNPVVPPRASRAAPPPPTPSPLRAPARARPVAALVQPPPTTVDALAAAFSKLEIVNDLLASTSADEKIIERFLALPLGSALDPHLIAHDASAQRALDNARVEWGTQWELARGVLRGLWTWEDVISKARELSGLNAEKACNVPAIMGKSASSVTGHDVWTELDREEKATREDPDRRLGLKGTYERDFNWHGGRIQQIVRLAKVDNKVGQYKIVMEPMERRRSHRFARFVGSRRMLQLRISDKAFMNEKDKVVEFLTKKFVLLGRVFVPFHSKDGSVYMVETNENYDRLPQDWCADGERLSFTQFMEWHNPLRFNSRQAISKYVTRFALGLSNSIPVLEFQPGAVMFIDDIYASDWPVGKKGAPAEKIMTDGCGFMNLAALQAITRYMGYEYLPTAVQGRFDGAKGLWIRHPYDESDEPRIWIRASQNKIKNHSLDRAHLIFELLTPSKPSVGDSLSQQSILNLYHNGVPAEDLIKLFEEGLREQVEPLLEWDNMVLLYHAVNKAGGVAGARMARLATTMSRAFGLERQQWGNDEVDATEEDAEGQAGADLGPATYTGRNPYSGCPGAIYEKILECIQAGFKPQDLKLLQAEIKQVMTTIFNTAIEKYRIPLKESLWAFVIPDPYAVSPLSHPAGSAIIDPLGLLGPREIYFRSSIPIKDPKTDMPYHVVTGEVVVGRYPIRLPSDMQRVTAVDVPELSGWTDVVIISAKGDRSLANLLSGGDMDGDTVHILREPEIVQHFKVDNPLVEEPKDLMQEFEKEVESVSAFCKRMLDMKGRDAEKRAAKAYQDVLLSNVKASNKGLYSMFHDQAVARYGYHDPRAIRLAYIFTTLLDASKSGLRLKPGVFEKDQKEFGTKPEPFGVLHDLKKAGKRLLEEFEDRIKFASQTESAARKDPALLAPYETISSYVIKLVDAKSPAAPLFVQELETIRKHVERAKDIFDRAAAQSKNDSSSKPKPNARGGKVKADQDDIMLEASRVYSQEAPEMTLIPNVEEVMASYAYALVGSPDGRFPWSVAFATLCEIKARATARNGQFASVLYQFDECKNISSTAVRVYTKSAEQEEF